MLRNWRGIPNFKKTCIYDIKLISDKENHDFWFWRLFLSFACYKHLNDIKYKLIDNQSPNHHILFLLLLSYLKKMGRSDKLEKYYYFFHFGKKGSVGPVNLLINLVSPNEQTWENGWNRLMSTFRIVDENQNQLAFMLFSLFLFCECSW